jgi:hypothetical protein
LGTPTGTQATHTAVDGDTVIMPTCTNLTPVSTTGNTWGDGASTSGPGLQRLVINAGITLMGQDTPGGNVNCLTPIACSVPSPIGNNQTVIIHNNASGAGIDPFVLIQIADSVTAPWRICCFTIRANQQNGPLAHGLINIGNSGSHAGRIDHMEIDTDQWSAPGTLGDDGTANCDNLRRWEGMALGGDTYMVADHNLYRTCRRRMVFGTGTTFADFAQTFSHANKSWSTGESLGMPGFPANDYQPPGDATSCGGTTGLGCQGGIVIEDNTVVQLATNTGSNAIGCEQGARCISRFNNLQCCIGQHGLEQDNTQGNRQHEAYGNTLTLPTTNRQGATNAVAFSNRAGIAIYFENSVTNSSLYVFNPADGVVGIDDTRYNGSTAAGNEWFNPWGPCNGSSSFTTSNGTATTLKNGGVNSAWDYIVGFPGTNTGPKPCMNQVGRGQGNLIAYTGNAPTGCPNCTSAVWPNEALIGSFYFANNFNGSIDPSGAYGSNGGTLGSPIQIVQNVDYFTGIVGGGAGTGATGVGVGLLSAIPATCTVSTSQDGQNAGVGYWATDKGNWNTSGKTLPDGTTQGVLYKCFTTATKPGQPLGYSCISASPNWWCVWYEPFTYPHPLVTAQIAPVAPQPKVFMGGRLIQRPVTEFVRKIGRQ